MFNNVSGMIIFENLYVGIEAGGAGRHLFHAVHDIEPDDIAEVGARFAVVP